jgi:hypothetical protein
VQQQLFCKWRWCCKIESSLGSEVSDSSEVDLREWLHLEFAVGCKQKATYLQEKGHDSSWSIEQGYKQDYLKETLGIEIATVLSMLVIAIWSRTLC